MKLAEFRRILARRLTIAGDDHKTVLFVCTGNTCRSPIAEAIARHLNTDPAVRIASAGVATQDGLPATPEAVEALHALGVDPGTHRSRRLTPAMVAEAAEIVCMTPAHLEQVLAMDPGARGKVTTLDDAPIPDPIGGPLELYVDTAYTLRALIERRMQEAQL